MTWQREVVDMIRGTAPLSGDLFAGSATVTGEEQIAIYAEQFRLRLWDAFVEEVPGWLDLVGADAADPVVFAFLADNPPAHWSIGRVADGFADWLAARGAPAAEVEMARLDAAVMRGFLAADGATPTPEALGVAGLRLRLQPHVTLLALRHGVHRRRSAWSEGRSAPDVEPGDWRLAVYRKDRAMKHVELEPGAYAALAALAPSGTVEDAVSAAFAADPSTPERLRGWFASFVERGLVEIAPAP